MQPQLCVVCCVCGLRVDFVGLKCQAHLGLGMAMAGWSVQCSGIGHRGITVIEMFLGLLVDLLSCQRFASDFLMECPPSTPWVEINNKAPPMATCQPKLTPPPWEPSQPEPAEPQPLTFLCWEPELDNDDGYGFDDPRLPELII